MLDFNKLGDMAKIAQQAKEMQQKQERLQLEQLEIMKKVSAQLDQVIALLKKS
jgi:hypothetical protein